MFLTKLKFIAPKSASISQVLYFLNAAIKYGLFGSHSSIVLRLNHFIDYLCALAAFNVIVGANRCLLKDMFYLGSFQIY
jgi:hypothetical protein